MWGPADLQIIISSYKLAGRAAMPAPWEPELAVFACIPCVHLLRLPAWWQVRPFPGRLRRTQSHRLTLEVDRSRMGSRGGTEDQESASDV